MMALNRKTNAEIKQTGKSVLITGGSRGIGKAIAKELNKQGYKVFAPSSKELDLKSTESIQDYIASNLKNQSLYALVSNGGVFESSAIEEMNESAWLDLIDVNLNGAFRVTKACLPLLKKSANSNIIYISSVSAQGEAYASAYTASKAALNGLTKSLAYELGSDGINVNAIAPGWVKTDMAKGILNTKNLERDNLGATIQNRWIEPKEIADLTAYLLDKKAKAITGQILTIDAGL
jgi:NAD(P)-dependent dehydrogenase (short-subunit alcohol dehydrogenase family)